MHWFFIAIAAAYLLGAIPFGLLIGWLRGIDVRQHGSKNIGATNVGRVVGQPWGYICLVLDALKGFLPALLTKFFLIPKSPQQPSEIELGLWVLVGVAAVLGHMFPVYLGFRGGKGVATTVGVALGIWPYFTIPMLISLAVYALVRFGTGWVSAGSLSIALVFPLSFYLCSWWANWPLGRYWPFQLVSILLGLLIIVRHRTNIQRILRGEEMRLRDSDLRSDPIGTAEKHA